LIENGKEEIGYFSSNWRVLFALQDHMIDFGYQFKKGDCASKDSCRLNREFSTHRNEMIMAFSE
jgi:hypothetical protein